MGLRKQSKSPVVHGWESGGGALLQRSIEVLNVGYGYVEANKKVHRRPRTKQFGVIAKE